MLNTVMQCMHSGALFRWVTANMLLGVLEGYDQLYRIAYEHGCTSEPYRVLKWKGVDWSENRVQNITKCGGRNCFTLHKIVVLNWTLLLRLWTMLFASACNLKLCICNFECVLKNLWSTGRNNSPRIIGKAHSIAPSINIQSMRLEL